MNRSDMREFSDYLRQCTDAQVLGVYEKEKGAQRWGYAELARNEAIARRLDFEDFDNE